MEFLHLKLVSFQAKIRISKVPKLENLPGLELCTWPWVARLLQLPGLKNRYKRRDIEPNLPDGHKCHQGCPRCGQEAGAAELGSPGLHCWQCLADREVALLASTQKSQPPPAFFRLYPDGCALPGCPSWPLSWSQTVFHQGLQRVVLSIKA